MIRPSTTVGSGAAAPPGAPPTDWMPSSVMLAVPVTESSALTATESTFCIVSRRSAASWRSSSARITMAGPPWPAGEVLSEHSLPVAGGG